MNAAFILEKLIIFDSVTRFISILELQFLSDAKLLSQIRVAKRSLDKALVNLAFDVERKLSVVSQYNSNLQPETYLDKPNISQEIGSHISNATEQLAVFNDQDLNQALQDLLLFITSYKTIETSPTQNLKDLENLRKEVLLIIAKRFG